jgi:glucose 1-dehydrogenase
MDMASEKSAVSGNGAFGLDGKVCVITGGGSGIGRATALAMAAEGAKVAVLDKNVSGAEETVDLLKQAGVAGAIGLSCDTTNEDSVAACRDAVTKQLGDADVLVNCAGTGRYVSLIEAKLEEWNRILSVNLTGYFICSQAFGRAMLARGSGALVHVSSIGAEHANANMGAYSVSKAGASMLSRLLASEWGPQGVRSNAVHPGLVQTPMTQSNYSSPEVAAARAAIVPVGRIAQPEEIAETIVFLASPRAAYVNGAQLLVDGGLSQRLLGLLPRAGQITE